MIVLVAFFVCGGKMTKEQKAIEEALAYLRTLANFGGTLVQSKELAQKGITKVEEILKDESAS